MFRELVAEHREAIEGMEPHVEKLLAKIRESPALRDGIYSSLALCLAVLARLEEETEADEEQRF